MFTCCQDDNAIIMDPFLGTEKHVLLGVANIFTQCLYHHICYEYDTPVIGPTGKVTIYSLLTPKFIVTVCRSVVV